MVTTVLFHDGIYINYITRWISQFYGKCKTN